MKRNYLIILVVLILLIIGIFLWRGSNQPQQSSQKQATKHEALPKEIVIILDKNGFSPKEVTVKAGTAVRWKNESGKPQTVNSDDYPSNQLHKELNFGVFANNSSLVYIFTKPGTYGYHNQLHHEQAGQIIVTQ